MVRILIQSLLTLNAANVGEFSLFSFRCSFTPGCGFYKRQTSISYSQDALGWLVYHEESSETIWKCFSLGEEKVCLFGITYWHKWTWSQGVAQSSVVRKTTAKITAVQGSLNRAGWELRKYTFMGLVGILFSAHLLRRRPRSQPFLLKCHFINVLSGTNWQ